MLDHGKVGVRFRVEMKSHTTAFKVQKTHLRIYVTAIPVWFFFFFTVTSSDYFSEIKKC